MATQTGLFDEKIRTIPDPALNKVSSFDITAPDRRILFKAQKSDRLKSLGIIQSLNEFATSMWQALQLHDPSITFEPAYPSYVLDVQDSNILRPDRPAREIPEKLITWMVVRRAPGSLDGKPFARGTREIRPRVREELVYVPGIQGIDAPDPEMHEGPGKIGPRRPTARVLGMETLGQFFDNLIQFDIWSKNNKTAEDLSEYLERFMEDFHGMFIELGVNHMHFHLRVRDELILNWRNGLVNRSLLYYVRTETVKANPVREIRTIHVDLIQQNFIDSVTSVGVDSFIKFKNDQTINKWLNK